MLLPFKFVPQSFCAKVTQMAEAGPDYSYCYNCCCYIQKIAISIFPAWYCRVLSRHVLQIKLSSCSYSWVSYWYVADVQKHLNLSFFLWVFKVDCPNFIRVLQFLNSTHMYACGTFAFSPRCTYIVSVSMLMSRLWQYFILTDYWAN